MGIDPSGMGEDIVYSWPQNLHPEPDLLTAMVPPGTIRHWEAMARNWPLSPAQHREQTPITPEVLAEAVGTAKAATPTGQEVAQRQQVDRIDVASRSDSIARDVAETGTELDL
jgi:hypothetical protein